jgi:hypothetical protein
MPLSMKLRLAAADCMVRERRVQKPFRLKGVAITDP